MRTKVTVGEAVRNSGISGSLIRAVIRQTGRENLEDIARHGVGGGFSGFIYHTETVAFFKRNRSAIVALAKQQAEDFGQDVISMIAGFNCLKTDNPEYRRELLDDIGRTLYGSVGEKETLVANALAWYAAEEVARAFNPDL